MLDMPIRMINDEVRRSSSTWWGKIAIILLSSDCILLPEILVLRIHKEFRTFNRSSELLNRISFERNCVHYTEHLKCYFSTDKFNVWNVSLRCNIVPSHVVKLSFSKLKGDRTIIKRLLNGRALSRLFVNFQSSEWHSSREEHMTIEIWYMKYYLGIKWRKCWCR